MLRYFTDSLKAPWNLMRVLRLVIGVFGIVEGVRQSAVPLALVGALLSVQALLNMGCCGSGACAPRRSLRSKTLDAREPVYQDISETLRPNSVTPKKTA